MIIPPPKVTNIKLNTEKIKNYENIKRTITEEEIHVDA